MKRKGRLFDKIVRAVNEAHFLVSSHAADRCEERGLEIEELIGGLQASRSIEERPRSKPNASIRVRQTLTDGTEVDVIWSWLEHGDRALLVTAFLDE